MRRFNFRLLEAFLALTLLTACTTPVTTRTFGNITLTPPPRPTHGSRSAITVEDATPPTEEEDEEFV